MDHGAERSEAPSEQLAGGPTSPRPASSTPTWARICVDVSDRQDVLGYSIEVHHLDTLEAVHVFPCGPFDDPVSVFGDAIHWLRATYGEQLALSLY